MASLSHAELEVVAEQERRREALETSLSEFNYLDRFGNSLRTLAVTCITVFMILMMAAGMEVRFALFGSFFFGTIGAFVLAVKSMGSYSGRLTDGYTGTSFVLGLTSLFLGLTYFT